MPGSQPFRDQSLLFFVKRSHRCHLAIACVLPLGTAGIEVALAWTLGCLFDVFSQIDRAKRERVGITEEIRFYLGSLMGLAFLTLLLNGTFTALWVYFGERQVNSARRRLFSSLLSRNVAWFEAREEGVNALMFQTQSHLLHFGLGISQSLGMALHSAISVVLTTSLGIYLMWDVTLVVLSPLPMTFVGMIFLSGRISDVITTRNTGMCRASGIVGNSIHAIDIVQCHNGQNSETRKYEIALRVAAEAHGRYALLSASQIAIARFTTLAMMFLGLWYGIYAIHIGRRTPGELLTTFWACSIATQSIERLTSLLPILSKGSVSARALRTLCVHNSLLASVTPRSSLATHRMKGEISLRNVSFSYDRLGKVRALCDVTLHVPLKTMVFVIGPSGSGKSTLASLLMRNHRPESGLILIDNIPIENYDMEWLHDHVTLVSQHAEIFGASLLQNLLISKQSIFRPSSTDIHDCLDFSGLADAVPLLPQGINTRIGRGGTSLSGGQQQRISLARAKLRDTPILILDEATSALDLKSREDLMRKLRQWRQGKTTILITHDYAHIQPADHVCFLENGRVIHQGAWNELRQISNLATTWIDPAQPYSKSFIPERKLAHRELALGIVIPTGSRMSIASGMLTPFSPLMPSPRTESPLAPVTALLSPQSRHGTVSVHSNLTTTISYHTSTHPTVHVPTITHVLSTIWPALDRLGRFQLIFGSLSAILHALSTPLFAYAFARVLQTLTLPPDAIVEHARGWIFTIAGLAVSDSTFAFLMHSCFESTSLKWVDDLRVRSFQTVLGYPRVYFDVATSSAEHIDSCLDKSAEEMRSLLSSFIPLMIVSSSMVTIAIVWSTILCWRLASMGLITALPLFLLSQSFEKASQSLDTKSHKASIAAGEILIEACTNVRSVHAFNLKSRIHRQYLRMTEKALRVGHMRAWKSGIFVGIIDASMILSQALIFWSGLRLVSEHKASLDTVVTVFSMLLFSISGAGAMVSSIPQVGAGQAAAARLLELSKRLELETPVESRIHPSCMPNPIRFSNFALRYPSRPSTYALRSLNMEISKGISTGLIGASGSGKTTILKALLGLYTSDLFGHIETEGALTFGRNPFSSYHLPTLRSYIGYVPQDVQLFPETIAQNIMYGRDSWASTLDYMSVTEAATLAGIDDFVLSLPDGYETRIGEGGLGLSLGQTQRIGIARAIARRPQLLIMDEPTSNLDLEAAAHVRNAIKTLVQQGTTVVVATHSTDMMMACDQLVLLDAGHTLEEGTWAELMGREQSHLRRLLECQQMAL